MLIQDVLLLYGVCFFILLFDFAEQNQTQNQTQNKTQKAIHLVFISNQIAVN
jgi:hypothetical protein